ncbi:uncharacterized protein L201_005885 [Kwoniella dendrophila CBS 6074]|uniref:Zn(2)-C6 fungal-type domain-containing protein n=1 Tax=Kwoniella dendrophila CBS 6074 TaxID=1295534 RepID=A0AAX4K013_9TREE
MTAEEQTEEPRPAKRKRITLGKQYHSSLISLFSSIRIYAYVFDICSNKRKVKCDRTWPCNNCRARNESDTCEYMEGHQPPPSTPAPNAVTSNSAEVETLKNRMAELENHIKRLVNLVDHKSPSASSIPKTSPLSHGTYATPYPSQNVPTPSSTTSSTLLSANTCGQSCRLDKHFLALDDLSRGYTSSPSSTPKNDISSNSTSNRSDVPRMAEAWPNIFMANDYKSSQTLYDIVAAIPKEDTLLVLVDHHFSNDGVFWHFVQENVFKCELVQFNQVRYTPNMLLVDPAWLALLVAILRIAIASLLSDNDLAVALLVGDKSALESMDKLLCEAFETALHGSRVLHKPQVRIFQALLILLSSKQSGRFLEHKDEKGVLWHDVAVSMCKHLRLSSTPESTDDQDLLVDPAFPPFPSLYTREWISRLSHGLLFMDEVITAIETDRRGGDTNHSIRLSAAEVTTPSPKNYRDEDLWNDKADTQQRIGPHPSFILTEVSFQLHGFRTAYLWKTISGLIREPSTMTTEIVRAIDADIRQGDYELLSLRTSHQLNRVQDILLESFHGSYQQRCLRLHRHFFLRSYEDSLYDFSQSAALSAARAIIKGHKDVVQKHNTFNPRFLALVFFSHHVSAATLLFIHGCLQPTARQGIQEELQSSLELFRKAQPPNGCEDQERWYTSVSRGRLFIEAMLNALYDNPPTDLPSIENYMMNLNRRGVEPINEDRTVIPQMVENQSHSLPNLPNFFTFIDTSNTYQTSNPSTNSAVAAGVCQSYETLTPEQTQMDWDSMFMGF